MHTYLISYDLIRPGKDYRNLHTHLESYGTWAKPLESVWLIKTSYGVEQLRNSIQAHMDANDKIFVVDVTSRAAAWDHLSTEVSTWIQNSL